MVTAYVAVCNNTVFKVILLGTTSSRTRNPKEEWLFRCELPSQGLGSQRRNDFLPGIASSWTRNLTEEWNSAGNHQLMDADSGWQDQNARKILRKVTIPGSSVLNFFLPRMSTSFQFKYENAIKLTH
jgi:hypothetical protein